MQNYILIAKGYEQTIDGKKHPKAYPYWDELITLLSKAYEVKEIPILPLKELEGLIKNSKAVICVDSFIQHYCWSIGKQAIVLWGQSDPLIFGHKENINLLKDRKYLRDNQFQFWTQTECNDDAFVKPKDILKFL